jgi:hypothetical protein
MLIVPFAVQKLFIWYNPVCQFLHLFPELLESPELFRKYFPIPTPWIVSPMVHPSWFSVLGLTLRSLTN